MLKSSIIKNLNDLKKYDTSDLLERRYSRLMSYGSL
jgi:acetyl-CoA carboxylase alpha subunit